MRQSLDIQRGFPYRRRLFAARRIAAAVSGLRLARPFLRRADPRGLRRQCSQPGC